MSGGNGLFLMGLKHCGKSTLGKTAAEGPSPPFYDLDDIALLAIRREGYSSIRELYRSAGLKKFQEFESAAADELAGEKSAGVLFHRLFEKRDRLYRQYAVQRLTLPVSFFLCSSTLSEVLHGRK
jgi:hypothetical protein